MLYEINFSWATQIYLFFGMLVYREVVAKVCWDLTQLWQGTKRLNST